MPSPGKQESTDPGNLVLRAADSFSAKQRARSLDHSHELVTSDDGLALVCAVPGCDHWEARP